MADIPDVTLSEQTGLPCAKLPRELMWELAEYLSAQRVQVSYSFHRADFTVSFLRTDREAARDVLARWEKFRQTAPAAPTKQFSDWIVGVGSQQAASR
jgi:hypothetical protein